MSSGKYIQFSSHSELTPRGVLSDFYIHDSIIPNASHEVAGVTADGVPIKFEDPSIPDKLHKAMVDGRKLQDKGIEYDCNAFSIILLDFKLPELPNNTTGLYYHGDPATLITKEEYVPGPVIIGHNMRSGFETDLRNVQWFHTLAAAHTEAKPTYLHKLGVTGPLCLSGLKQALQFYRCNTAATLDVDGVTPITKQDDLQSGDYLKLVPR